jgi:hypothetical protein
MKIAGQELDGESREVVPGKLPLNPVFNPLIPASGVFYKSAIIHPQYMQ